MVPEFWKKRKRESSSKSMSTIFSISILQKSDYSRIEINFPSDKMKLTVALCQFYNYDKTIMSGENL